MNTKTLRHGIITKELGYLDAYHYKYHAYVLWLDDGYNNATLKHIVDWHRRLHREQ